MPAVLRPYHPSDQPGLYRVCLATGDAGRDATPLYRDPDLLGHVYAGPYPVADPGLTWVVTDDAGRVAGYVVATADTRAFDDWLEQHWWPVLRARYARRADPGDGTRDHVLVDLLHDRSRADVPAGFPAHLHIDLLPHLQGQGWGRRLVATLSDALRARGVPGLHLGVAAQNTGAVAFYERIGMRVHESFDWGYRMVLPLA
ncbi:GNAT family N-acetyltransferase [Cellulomonas shaoxiangyii]|uniref:GNAT family N-acetyltransferase n=1 Tax=Cellulomonas shaoxiangyii TaxID=2566013 RepID=A0A4P7SKY2_9CELL|nr:GNAT family N-acetyltransferase [Cellulomonas shaoxiangyii]QCB94872.1 GNAT family N-acetyltransferase [Cellulomonas shaoxiangyii]TGY85101.1 GNAT family N-acetyltransferase [Cellulomonas shaoxiangyii]